MKRRFTVILPILLTVLLCGCSIFPQNGVIAGGDDTPLSGPDTQIGYHMDKDGYWVINRADYVSSDRYEPLFTPHSYQRLVERDERLGTLYEKLADAVYCLSGKNCSVFNALYDLRFLTVSGEYSEAEAEASLVAVLDDHPEIFWMSTDINVTVESASAENARTLIELHAVYPPQKVVAMMRQLNDALSAFYAGMPDGELSPYERESYVYKYIIDHCVYDDDIEENDEYSDAHPSIYNLYGVLVDRKAVCEGYSRAFDYLCSQLGVDTVCICGVANGQNDSDAAAGEASLHMWNAVRLDGEWYWADCTWDDWDEDESLGDVFYYLNVTDDILFCDHTVDKTYDQISGEEYAKLESYINSFIPPACTAAEYCYYLRESVHLSELSVEMLSDGMVQAARKNRKSLLVYVDTTAYTPQSMADALFDGSQPYYEALDKANEKMQGTPLNAHADAVYYTDDDRKLLIFELNYE